MSPENPKRIYVGQEEPEPHRKLFTFLRFAALALCIILFVSLPWMFLGIGPDSKSPETLKGEEQARELAKHREWETNRLNSYDWADREKNLIRIPIDKAMKLTLEKKLPARSQAAPEF